MILCYTNIILFMHICLMKTQLIFTILIHYYLNNIYENHVILMKVSHLIMYITMLVN